MRILKVFVSHSIRMMKKIEEHMKYPDTASIRNATQPHLRQATPTTITVESNNGPTRYSINTDVREEYRDIVNTRPFSTISFTHQWT